MFCCLKLGPNVSIGPGVNVGAGVRIRESIILDNAIINDHTLVLHSISKDAYNFKKEMVFTFVFFINKFLVGRESTIGNWARVEGTPSDPDPNKPFAKMENPPLFNVEGKLNPSITILGK